MGFFQANIVGIEPYAAIELGGTCASPPWCVQNRQHVEI